MKKIIYILLCFPVVLFSQKKETEKESKREVKLADKQVLRKGNDLYNQKRFVDAEAKYKKALQQNRDYETAYYNLANTFYEQDKYEDALPGYDMVAKVSEDKETKSQSFHNMGNVFMKQKQYAKAISVYKNSLRLNPEDDETRYNLALAQDLLKDQNKDQNKDDKDNKENKEKNKDQNEENKDKKEEQGDDEKKDKDQNKGDDNKDKKDKNKEGDNEKNDKPPPKPDPNKLSQQQIQQLLEAMNNEENKTQKKVNAKKAKGRKVNQEKDW